MPERRHTLNDLEIIEFTSPANGPAVIFLHGGPGLYGYMQTFAGSLAQHCQAVYYEQRGSRQGNLEVGIEDHLQDLARIVDHYAKDSKPIIVGHSWGAMLAVLFAGRHSNRLQKAILIGCGPLSKHQGEVFQEELQKRFGNRQDYYDDLWSALSQEEDEVRQQKLADHYIDELMEIYQMDPTSGSEIQPRHWDFRGGYRAMCESEDYIANDEYVKALSTICVPLTIMHGRLDPVSPNALFDLARKHVSELSTFEFAKAGHYPWAGPDRETFLERLKQELGSS